MFVRDDGVVIVDTGMMVDDATRIMAEFRKLSDKPIKAIIFTHSHGDHTGGAAAFIGAERPQIWAHKNFGSEAQPLIAGGVTFHNVRAARQAGFKLPQEDRINNGVAPARYPKRGGEAFATDSATRPTHFLDGNPSNLFRLSSKSEAERVAKLAGGTDSLLAAANDALTADDDQWASQLADHLLAIDKDSAAAKQIKADALTKLADNMVNATARNYYLTVARELRESAIPE
jgi:alkyl sulfatase BDS1-like metallo-beta-lactamase superfamily hydrolase